MRSDWTLGFLLLLMSCGSALSQSPPCLSQSPDQVTIGRDAFAYHQEALRDAGIKLQPAVTADAELLVEMVGIPNTSRINALCLQMRRSPGIANAISYEGKGYRTIAYDPNAAAFDTAAFYLAIGHEVGHHFCGHSVGNISGNRVQTELEADQFAGASIKRLEVYRNQRFFGEVMAAAAVRYPEQGSALYPSRALRLEALKRGYEQGSPCGDLAPVEQSGFVPNERATGPPGRCRPVKTGPTSYACAR